MKVDSESESHSCHSDLANQVVRRIDLENNKNPIKAYLQWIYKIRTVKDGSFIRTSRWKGLNKEFTKLIPIEPIIEKDYKSRDRYNPNHN